MAQQGLARTVALGAWLATRGALPSASFVLAGLGALGAIVGTLVVSRHDGTAAGRVPAIAAEAIAWGAGSTLAFGASLRALHRDRQQGILALVRARGISTGTYVLGRVGGLVLVLAATLVLATLAVALAATSIRGGLPGAIRHSVAAIAYVVAFAATLGPVAMACLATSSRVGGYLTLLAVVVVPELLSPWTSALLPRGWGALTSIPAALDAVRAAAGSTGSVVDCARAVAALALVIAVSLVVVRTGAAYVEAGRRS